MFDINSYRIAILSFRKKDKNVCHGIDVPFVFQNMGIIILIALQNVVIFMMIELTFSWPWKRIILLICNYNFMNCYDVLDHSFCQTDFR